MRKSLEKRIALYLAGEDYPHASQVETEVIASTTPYPERAFDIVTLVIMPENDDASLSERVAKLAARHERAVWRWRDNPTVTNARHMNAAEREWFDILGKIKAVEAVAHVR